MSVMGGRKTTSGYPREFTSLGHNCTVGNTIDTLIGYVLPIRLIFSIFPFPMIFNRGAAEKNKIARNIASKTILLRQAVLSMNAPGFAYSNLMGKAYDFSPFISRYFRTKKVLENVCLPSAFDFRLCELFHIKCSQIRYFHSYR